MSEIAKQQSLELILQKLAGVHLALGCFKNWPLDVINGERFVLQLLSAMKLYTWTHSPSLVQHSRRYNDRWTSAARQPCSRSAAEGQALCSTTINSEIAHAHRHGKRHLAVPLEIWAV